MTERDRLDLRGLLPPNVFTTQQQIDRFSKSSLISDVLNGRVVAKVRVLMFLNFFVNSG